MQHRLYRSRAAAGAAPLTRSCQALLGAAVAPVRCCCIDGVVPCLRLLLRSAALCPSTDVAALMPGSHALCSVNYKVAVSMARLRMEDSNRALRDRALYKPALPPPARSSSPPPPLPPTRWPRKRKNKKKKKKQKAKATPVQRGEDDALATHPRTVHIGRKYRRDRPWLSARELRDRAREDIRERCDHTPPTFSASDAMRPVAGLPLACSFGGV
eukprot:COSAG01_NODE_534_length_15805_cov_9.468420_17_plen_214_part_00